MATMSLNEELKKYKQKYYTNQLLKGLLVSAGLLLSVYMSLNFLEYLGRFNSVVRAVFFFSFVILLATISVAWIIRPILKLLNLNRQISDEEAARQIGQYFPEIDDKLLNTIQLQKTSETDNALIRASITQRTQELSIVKFTDAIKLSENRRYMRWLAVPLLLLLLIFLASPSFFTELFTKSSARIIRYNETFAEPAPFQFILANKKLQAFKNEDFSVNLKLDGRAVPSEVFLINGGRKYKMSKDEKGVYSYLFPKLQKNTDFTFEAAGFNSKDYTIQLIERPSLLSFNAALNYPAYLGKPAEKWNNIGNLVVPEGTRINWQFNTNQADKLFLIFNEGKDTVNVNNKGEKVFEHGKFAKNSETYQVRLLNKYSANKEEINYYINVIPDRYPKISMQDYQDSAVYNFLSVGGSISDDYGLSALKMFYRVNREGKTGEWKGINISISTDQSIQNFYYQLDMTQMSLQPGDNVEYFAQVWDNDGVNGAKSSKTGTNQFKIPSEKDFKKELDESVSNAESQIDKTIKKAQQLKSDVNNLENKLRQKDRLEYQDKKMAEEILKKREDLIEEIKKLQEQNNQLNDKQERFQENSEKITEKMEQLQKLMDELLDEETKKLYEELEKLLEQNRDTESVQDKLKEISEKEENLEKELERALEMFKQLQFEQKMEQTVEDLKKLAEEQQKLAEETEKSKDDKNNENKDNKDNKDGKDNKENKEKANQELQEKQKELNEKFEELKKDLDELEKMDKDLENPNGMEEQNDKNEEQEKEIDQEQDKSLEELQKNQNKKAAKSQKNAGQKMQKMAQQMEQMEMEMEMEGMQENIDDLRAILENLVTLSFDQENLMKDFRTVNLSDPRYIKLAQQQLKLKDDGKIIEDSLNALAKRVFQIQSFVTHELGDMKKQMNESSDMIKQRKLSQATGKQQGAMTSMNNLALMLSEVLQQMQNAMQNAMSSPSKGKKKGNKPQKSPSLGQLQQQLNQKIQELKQSGKSGRQLSEELAKLAAEQQRIREALRQLEKMAGQQDKNAKEQLGKQLNDIGKQMEEIEEDLVNKRLERISQNRQKDIETRLLESEKSMRERGEEEERKAEQAKAKKKTAPPALQQYFKTKEKQIELLKTVPPALSPYYKKEVDEYFEKINK
ncbi:MAG: ATPase [Microscillaceae bacterium]|jgi:hypothetical protein|nr:ATPase [Microscillaceae bacterium]